MPSKTFDSLVAAGLATVAICFGGLAVWGEESDAARETTSAPTSFRILYERSGGYAPSTSTLIVGPGLNAVAATQPGGGAVRKVRFRIARERVRAIERGLRNAHFNRLRSGAEITCADCYFYEVAYGGHRVKLDSGHVTRRLEPVLAELEAIVTSHAGPRGS